MPVVPMPSRQPSVKPVVPAQPMPPEPFQLMAAAQMHAEGRLIKKDEPADGK